MKQLIRRVLHRLDPRVTRKLIELSAPVRSRLTARVRGHARTVANEEGYSSSESARFNLTEVTKALGDHSIEFAVLPSPGPYRPIVVVSAEDLEKAVHVLTDASNMRRHGFVVRIQGARRVMRRGVKMTNWLKKNLNMHQQTVLVTRPLKTTADRPLHTRYESVTVQGWDRLPEGADRADGGQYQPGTLIRHGAQAKGRIAYLEPAAWSRAQEEPGHAVAVDDPLLEEVTFPVDVVYTWVDGDDPNWRRRMRQVVEGDNFDASAFNETATSNSRFVSHDELKYSLRSLAMYADWVRNVYIVTDQQIPDWLDTDNPRIKIVDHRDIFADPDALPVFNSHAIESQLHHIEGLSDHYLYLNDDIFFCRPTQPSLFFTSSGISKFFLSKAVLDVSPATSRDLPVLSAAKNNRKLIEDTFGRVITNKFKHTPHAQNRLVLKEMEERYPDVFDTVMRSQLRHPDDYSITSALYHYYAYLSGRAVESQIRYSYIDVSREDLELLLWRLQRQHNRWDVLCLNQTTDGSGREEEIGRRMQDFLEDMFPIRSWAEK